MCQQNVRRKILTSLLRWRRFVICAVYITIVCQQNVRRKILTSLLYIYFVNMLFDTVTTIPALAQIYNLCCVYNHCAPTECETQNIDVSTALAQTCNLCHVHNHYVSTECETQNIDVSTLYRSRI